MNAAARDRSQFVLVIVALAGATACATTGTERARSPQDPHARALVLAMAHDASRQASAAGPGCGAVEWTIVRPYAPGVIDSTGWLRVRACRVGTPCRDFYVDVWKGSVSDRPEWKGGAGRGGAPRLSLPPVDLERVRARLPRSDAALLLVLAHEDPTALVGKLEIDPWFDTERRTWRAEPARYADEDLRCDRWMVDLRIEDSEVMRWTVDLAVGSVSRSNEGPCRSSEHGPHEKEGRR